MTRQALLLAIKDAAYLEGNFITRSGKPTTYYIDKYLFSTKPEILKNIAEGLLPLLPPADSYDRIGVPELGAVPIGAALSILANKPFFIVRKATKDYGTKRLIEGQFNPGETVVMVEDVLTTGGAILQACDVVRGAGLKTTQVLGIINREEGATEALQAQGLTLTSLFTRSDFNSL